MTPAEFENERAHLFAIAYRMIGSASEAEDIVQEAWLRVANETDAKVIESPRAYLTTIVVRLCFDQIKSARNRREAYVGPWLPEPIAQRAAADASPTPESNALLAESLHIAFLVVLERLTPLERAAFLLRDVFDHDLRDIGGMLGTSEEATKKLVQRARAHVEEGRTRFEAPPARKEELLRAFVAACMTGEVDVLSRLLADDVVARSDGGGKVLAALRPIVGPDRVARFLFGVQKKFPAGHWPELVAINGEAGIILRDATSVYTVVMLSVRDDRIMDVFIINNPDKLSRVAIDLGISA